MSSDDSHDLWIEHLGDELGKLSVKDRMTALFCCCEVHELVEIVNRLIAFLRSEERTRAPESGKTVH